MLKVLSFLLIFSSSAFASDLDQLILKSWESDPFLEAQKSKIQAAEIDQIARFLPNSPTLSFADADNHSWRTYGVTLPFGFPGKAFAYSRLDRQRVQVENKEMLAKKIELARFVYGLYADCMSKKELVAVLSLAVKELGILKEAITARYEMGQSTQAERIGIELQYRQADIENMTLREQKKVACSKFSDFVSDKKFTLSLEEEKLPTDLSADVLNELGTDSLEFIRSTNEKVLSHTTADLAAWSIAPDISLSYYRNYYNRVVASPIIPVQWTNTFMISVNIPILYPFYERSEYHKLRAENIIAAERARMRGIEAQKESDNAVDTYQRNRKIFKKLLDHDLPMAEAMVDATLAAYRQGKLGFSELVLARRTWLDLKKEEVQLKQSILNARLICLKSCEGI